VQKIGRDAESVRISKKDIRRSYDDWWSRKLNPVKEAARQARDLPS